jgi:hypothetical protein
VNFLAASLALLFAAQISTPADFVRTAGDSLRARFDSAMTQGRRESAESFWIAYQFPVRPGVRVNTWDGNVNISRGRSSDGIEFLANTEEAERVGLFMLVRRADGLIEKSRVINLKQDFRVHDRKVFWLGEPAEAESATFLAAIIPSAPQRAWSSLLMTVSLHPESVAPNTLLQIARNSSQSSQLRRDAIYWLGQEVSRQAGEELAGLANTDPDVEVQKQAVYALSRRDTEESLQAVFRIAKDHPNAAVRRQAIYWLGQKRDPRVLDLLEQLLKN